MVNESKRIDVGITRDFISSEGSLDFVEKIWDELANHPVEYLDSTQLFGRDLFHS